MQTTCFFTVHILLNVIYVHFSYRTNQKKYDLVFLEAIFFQSYYGLFHHIGSLPVIGILSLEAMWSAAEAMGNPTTPAMIPQVCSLTETA
jgi:hypothetical protein